MATKIYDHVAFLESCSNVFTSEIRLFPYIRLPDS